MGLRKEMLPSIFLVLVAKIEAQCVWSYCSNKAAILVSTCSSGHSRQESADCGQETCIMGFCIYTNEKQLCCPDGSSCQWYDTGCNWAALKNYFVNPRDEAKEAWKTISTSVQEKLTTSERFKTLTESELLSLDGNLLAEVRSVAGMTAQQLSIVKDTVLNMKATQLTDFLSSLHADVLAEGFPSLVSDAREWSSAQASMFFAKLQSAATWGKATSWNSTQLASLGSMISALDLATLQSLPGSALAHAANLRRLGAEQLRGLMDTFANMSSTDFIAATKNANMSSLLQAVPAWGASAARWGFDKVGLIIKHLGESGDHSWGPFVTWTGANVSALGNMLTWVEVDTLMNMTNEALADATNLGRLSAKQINGLGAKLGSMSTPEFVAMLSGVDARQLHSAMLAQCEITCARESDLVFLSDPTLQNAESAFVDYSQRVADKATFAAVTYAVNMCSGASITEVVATSSSEAAACNGSAVSDNDVSTAFESWGMAEHRALLQLLTGNNHFGDFEELTKTKLASLCNQYAALTPANIAKIGASVAISVGVDAVATAVFGPMGPAVLELGAAVAARSITPEQRKSWAGKIKEGFGEVKFWGCGQVASVREMAAGLSAGDLSVLTVDAAKGVLAGAITAMDGSTVAGLGPSQIMSLVSDARNRLSGKRLSKFNQHQMVAAVCGSEWLVNVTQGDANCPSMIVDIVLKFPEVSMPSKETIINKLKVQGSSSPFTARIMSILPETERPNMGSARRLSTTAKTEVTVRMSFPNVPANGDDTVASIQQAAEALVAPHAGSVSATQHNVAHSPQASSASQGAVNGAKGRGAPPMLALLVIAVSVTRGSSTLRQSDQCGAALQSTVKHS